MSSTKIEWCDRTWSPITGCSKVSEGCKNCWAERMSKRLAGRCGYPVGDPFHVTMHPGRLGEPLQWKKPQRVFVCSMGDLFHNDIPPIFIKFIFNTIERCPQHTFLILTKRPRRAYEVLAGNTMFCLQGPLPNLWIGVSIEDQKTADERIPVLLQVPAAKRFVSVEPMLGPVNLEAIPLPDAYLTMNGITGVAQPLSEKNNESDDYVYFTRHDYKLDWVICGGETGPKARPIHPDWVRSLRDQCVVAGVPFFFKQWGEWSYTYGGIPEKAKSEIVYSGRNDSCVKMWRVGKKAAGTGLDGKIWREFPAWVA